MIPFPEGLNISYLKHDKLSFKAPDEFQQSSTKNFNYPSAVSSQINNSLDKEEEAYTYDAPFNALLAQQSSSGDVCLQRIWIRHGSSFNINNSRMSSDAPIADCPNVKVDTKRRRRTTEIEVEQTWCVKLTENWETVPELRSRSNDATGSISTPSVQLG